MTILGRFGRGFSFLLAGVLLLKRERSLRKWVVIPLCIDVILLLSGWSWGSSLVVTWATKAVTILVSQTAGVWFSLLYYPLLLILGVGFFALWLYAIIVVANIIAAPFNALLAEASLEYLGQTSPSARDLKSRLALALRMLAVSLQKGVILAMLGVVIFVMSFIPGVNLVAAFGALMLMAFDVLDYSLEPMGLGLRARIGFFKSHFFELAGMAAGLALTLVIPGLTILALPVAVVGAAAVVSKTHRPDVRKAL